MTQENAIELNQVTFYYQKDRPCLNQIEMKIKHGECIVLCGASGSGKSSILRLLNGLAVHMYQGEYTGRILLLNQNELEVPIWKRAELMGTVYQEPASQFFSKNLKEEIAFTIENLGVLQSEIYEKVEKITKFFQLENYTRQNIDTLSSGEKQRVAIASACISGAKILLLDEPSANLDETSTKTLLKLLEKLKETGHTLVISEHRIGYLKNIADRFLLLQNGMIRYEYSSSMLKQLSKDKLKSLGLRCLNPPTTWTKKAALSRNPTALLQIENLGVSYNKKSIFSNVSFTVSEKEIVAIVGENGCGKTTLCKCIAGLQHKYQGKIKISKRLVPSRKRSKEIWYTPNDVRYEFFGATVEEELLIGLPKNDNTTTRVKEILIDFNLWDIRHYHPYALSGGQMQRLSIACGILQKRKILLLDEPTSGLDGYHLGCLENALKKAAENGIAVIATTHDIEFIERCCTHVYVMTKSERGKKNDGCKYE